MTFLSKEDKERLRRRIEAVEGRTRGELVTVIARESDPYPYIPLLWACIASLLLPPLAALAGDWTGIAVDLLSVSLIQLVTFLALSLLFRWTPLKMRLIPRRTKLRRAARTARERCGVMIFVSVGEHYVEILADRGISEKVAQAEWDVIVADFVQAVKRGEIAAGFEQAVEACGRLLATHFPAPEGGRRELPDHLIEI